MSTYLKGVLVVCEKRKFQCDSLLGRCAEWPMNWMSIEGFRMYYLSACRFALFPIDHDGRHIFRWCQQLVIHQQIFQSGQFRIIIVRLDSGTRGLVKTAVGVRIKHSSVLMAALSVNEQTKAPSRQSPYCQFNSDL